MINNILLEKYAKLAVKIGANVKKGELVHVNSSTESKELVRSIVKEAYLAGASKVVVNWTDDFVTKYDLLNQDKEALSLVPKYTIDKYLDFIENKGCVISIKSPVPSLLEDIPSDKLQAKNSASRKALSFYYDNLMGSKNKWSLLAAPNQIWAEKIFPDSKGEEAVDKLWKAILDASRVTIDNDPIKEWQDHNKRLLKHNNILNDYNFDTLYFKNSIGTNVSVKLVENHIWAGGGEYTPEGQLFNPNIPTEENFTMPDKHGVNGKVVASKPLDYQGKLIENFWIEFKNGKVVDFDAETNKEALASLINLDEGSCYLGEIALISYDSPISNSGILFYNTLFDENASCHMALGRAYTINIKGGTKMSLEELKEKGYNYSMAHSDFMFGTKDLSVIGKTKEGKIVTIFEKGNFVI